MNKQGQVEAMAVIGCVRNSKAHTAEECAKCDFKQGMCNAYRHAEALYEAGYRKTFTSDLASDTQKAFKEGYSKGVDYGIEFGKVLLYKTRKETAKEIFQKVINICRKELDFQDGTKNTQLAPLYLGIINGCDFIKDKIKELSKDYDVEVEE